jgi:hypothetical protein
MAFSLISSSQSPSNTATFTMTYNVIPTGSNTSTVAVVMIAGSGVTQRITPLLSPGWNNLSMSKVPAPWFPYSASGDEQNIEMWYFLKPPAGLTTVRVGRATSTVFGCICTFSSSAGDAFYVTQSSRATTSTVLTVTMSALPITSGNIFYTSMFGIASNNPNSTDRQLEINSADAGLWNWAAYVQSQSVPAPEIVFGGTNGTSDTWAGIIAAFGEPVSYKTYTMVVGGDDMLY